MASPLNNTARHQVFFCSAKTAAPIPASTKMRSEALVLATLDPGVTRIEYLPEVTVGSVLVPLRGILLSGERARHLLDLPDDGPTPDFDEEGLRLLAVEQLGIPTVTWTAADILRQPLAGNARLTWRARYVSVAPDDRVRILAHLEEASPTGLVEVASLVRRSPDGVSAVLALACHDLLELDLDSAPLGPWTAVRRRRRGPG